MARVDGDNDDNEAREGGEFTRKWTEREEAALIAYWRENVAKYATKTKRFFYDEAARIPELRQKTTAQIKSKCFDTEKRYRDTNHMLRAAGVEVSDGANPDASRKWVLKKFSLYYDVHPFLGPRDPASNGLTGEDTRGINGQVGSPEPPAAGVRSFVAPATGKKRVLNGHAANVESSTPPRIVSKRHRAEIERFVKANEEVVANVNAVSGSNDAPAGVPTSNDTLSAPSAPSGANAGANNQNQYAPHVQENSAMVEAATEKMRAEARLATIRANAALLRERKALMNEGISVDEINALLPLEPSRVV